MTHELTKPDHPSGTDRIYAALKTINNYKTYKNIINLQGDMPLIKPEDIARVNEPILKGFDIGTLSTNLSIEEESNINITKVEVEWIKENLPPSTNELNYKLEQWRALDADMTIGVSFVENIPISVDTKEDLIYLENIIKTQK